jgi:hypothetical protein
VNLHILGHIVVGIGAIVLFVAPFFGSYRNAPLYIRILLLLMGPVGIAWSAIGLYLMHYTNAQGYTTLPREQFFVLEHAKAVLGGFGPGILTALFINPAFYRRKSDGNTQHLTSR